MNISVVSPVDAAICIVLGFEPIGFALLPRGEGRVALFSADAKPALEKYHVARERMIREMGVPR